MPKFIVKIIGDTVGQHHKFNRAISQAHRLVDINHDRISVGTKTIPTLLAYKCNVYTDAIWTIINEERNLIVRTYHAQGQGAVRL